MNLRVASDRLGYCPDRPLLHLSYAFEPPAVHAIGVDLAPLGAAGHLRPHPAPRLHPLAPELGTHLALTGAGADHTNYTSKRNVCVNGTYRQFCGLLRLSLARVGHILVRGKRTSRIMLWEGER